MALKEAILRACMALPPAPAFAAPALLPDSIVMSAGARAAAAERRLAAAIWRIPPAKDVGPTTLLLLFS